MHSREHQRRKQNELAMASPLAAVLLLCIVLGAHLASCEELRLRRSPVIRRARGVPTTGCYIVAMKDDVSEEELQQVAAKAVKASDDAKLHGLVQRVKKAFTVKLNPYALEMVRHLPGVDYIEEEGFAVGDQNDTILPWQVDRIDQNRLPLNYIYNPIGEGEGVDVYILDSGINYDHEEFEYRAKYGGYDPVDEYTINVENEANHQRRYGRDCHGHGTHVASICGGKTYGSAKQVNIYSIRVLGCNNAAPWSVVIDGLNYVSGVVPERGRPAIISMSLSGAYHRAVNEVVERLASEGITVVTVAGNGRANSCGRSPGSSDSAITVAGSSSVDGLYTSTNYGACVDIFAPGLRIRGADMNCTKCYKYLSGTSMAAPLVSGVAAIHLSRKPRLSPADVKDALISDSVRDALTYDEEIIPRSSWALTKNRLLQIQGSCGGSQFFLNSGTITSPGYPTNYPADLCCMWNITAEENQFVQFDLYDLHLEDKYDVLKVYDGSCPYSEDDDTDLVTEFTGFRGLQRYIYRTESNVLCLKLVTDGTTSFKGFNATYTKFYNGTDIKATECGRNFTTSSMGTFQTPNWPQNYPTNLDCEWFIQLPDARTLVEITCEDEPFGIAGSYPGCTEDYITLYDGYSSQNTIYGPYCEFKKPGTIKMSSNLARVHFYAGANHSSNRVGVKCSFQSVDGPTTTPQTTPPRSLPPTTISALLTTILDRMTTRPLTTSRPPPTTPLPSQCGGLLTTSSGTFQTPNWPETYPVNIDCEWRIQLPDSSTVVEIRCEDNPFGIAGSLPACSLDYLKFYDGHSKQDTEFGPFCHYTKPSTTTMSSNKAMAVFHAGPMHNSARKGFKCSFQSVDLSDTSQCGEALTAASGSFQTPNWPQTYPVNVDCTWTITLPDSTKRVDINFGPSFGIAGSLPTCKDKVYVYDDNTGTQFGPYCHFTVPNPPTMTSNRARVVLHAGPSHSPSRRGFTATYRSL